MQHLRDTLRQGFAGRRAEGHPLGGGAAAGGILPADPGSPPHHGPLVALRIDRSIDLSRTDPSSPSRWARSGAGSPPRSPPSGASPRREPSSRRSRCQPGVGTPGGAEGEICWNVHHVSPRTRGVCITGVMRRPLSFSTLKGLRGVACPSPVPSPPASAAAAGFCRFLPIVLSDDVCLDVSVVNPLTPSALQRWPGWAVEFAEDKKIQCRCTPFGLA